MRSKYLYYSVFALIKTVILLSELCRELQYLLLALVLVTTLDWYLVFCMPDKLEMQSTVGRI